MLYSGKWDGWKLGARHRRVFGVQHGIEQLAHARFDRLRQAARDDDARAAGAFFHVPWLGSPRSDVKAGRAREALAWRAGFDSIAA